MTHYVHRTVGTCSSAIEFEINSDQITDVRFMGGCPGNAQAIARLVNGMTVEQIESKLAGIRCGGKPTSCADQLARGVREAFEGSGGAQSPNRRSNTPRSGGGSYRLTVGPFD